MQTEQIINEIQFQKKNILRTEALEMREELHQLTKKIEQYKCSKYWESKNKRIKQIQLDSRDIATELVVIILDLPIHKPIQLVASKLSHLIGSFDSVKDGITTASEIINQCEGIIYEIELQEKEEEINSYMLVPLFESDHLEWLESIQYPLPMLVEPRKWVSNNEGGWLSKQESVVHGSMNHHNETQALEALNQLQSIEWELDQDMLLFPEVPNKELDTQEKKDQFRLMKEASKKAYKEIGTKPFYFVWRFDKRGRMYSQGYQINLQSTNFKKAILNTSKKQIVTGEL